MFSNSEKTLFVKLYTYNYSCAGEGYKMKTDYTIFRRVEEEKDDDDKNNYKACNIYFIHCAAAADDRARFV